jgi:hypothetical protein
MRFTSKPKIIHDHHLLNFKLLCFLLTFKPSNLELYHVYHIYLEKTLTSS